MLMFFHQQQRQENFWRLVEYSGLFLNSQNEQKLQKLKKKEKENSWPSCN